MQVYALINTEHQSKTIVGHIESLHYRRAGFREACERCKVAHAEIEALGRWVCKFPTVWRVELECAAYVGREVPWSSEWCVPLTSEEYEAWREVFKGKRTHPYWQAMYESPTRVRLGNNKRTRKIRHLLIRAQDALDNGVIADEQEE